MDTPGHEGIPVGEAVDDGPILINVACGYCGSAARVGAAKPGLVQFHCPACGAQNEVTYKRPAGGKQTLPAVIDYPPWWTKQPKIGQVEIQACSGQKIKMISELVERTWKNVTTRDRSGKPVPKLTVLQVQQNHNPLLWSNYVQAREAIRAKMRPEDRVQCLTGQVHEQDDALFSCIGAPDSEVNEFLLFHGSKPSAVESICKSDFMVRLAGANTGTLLGPGIYFAECSSKSDEYAQDDQSGIYQGIYAMLLCRVACGRMYYTADVKPDVDAILSSATGDERRCHSVLGDREKCRGTYKEYVVFNNDQAYPEYIILYRRSED